MRLLYAVLGLIFLFSGCMPNGGLSDSAASEINIVNISRIEKGMTQAEVLKIMRHPYNDAVFDLEGDVYDIWFYVTEPRVLGQSRMMPTNLTPLAFKNGILIGWGYRYYEFIRNRKRMLEKAAQPSPPRIEKPKETEDLELQRILKESVVPPSGSPQPTGAPSKPPAPKAPAPPPTKGAKPASPKPQSKAPGGGQSQSGSNWEAVSPQPTPQSAPQSQSNWEALEKEPRLAPPPVAPPVTPAPPIQPEPVPTVQTPQQVSMSSPQKKNQSPPSDQTKKPQPTKEEEYPMDEGDQDMLEKERMQDFDQT